MRRVEKKRRGKKTSERESGTNEGPGHFARYEIGRSDNVFALRQGTEEGGGGANVRCDVVRALGNGLDHLPSQPLNDFALILRQKTRFHERMGTFGSIAPRSVQKKIRKMKRRTD